MEAEMEYAVATRDCPICRQVLPISEFGICRARKDGLNLYCKSCIRQKVTNSRRARREYDSAKQRGSGEQAVPGVFADAVADDSQQVRQCTVKIDRMTPVERVREAIRRGARTQKEIAQVTKLGKDEIGDALANLLLWTREVRTEVIKNTRLYFINDLAEDLFWGEVTNLPRRKPDVPSSFSALLGLMPGRNPEGEPEKIGGWVAA